MKKLLLYSLMIIALPNLAVAQKYFTKNGTISFFSKTPLENISADNNQTVSVLNTQNGEFNFSLLVRNFHFKKALMEEHFNENYMESDKLPKAAFKGNIADPAKVNFTQDGTYNITVTGDLTIHGVTHKISAPGTITVKGGVIAANSKFIVKPEDYNISIPKIVRENIAETIEVTVSCSYQNKM
ncbi:MAG: YceI family protein [Ferruginibacter sp.]